MTWLSWILAALLLCSVLVLIEQLIEEHEDRAARRGWHSTTDDQDTVPLPTGGTR